MTFLMLVFVGFVSISVDVWQASITFGWPVSGEVTNDVAHVPT